ncbi:MAG: PGPGW domain-containing protein [Rubripirellula sp.]
MPPLSNIFETTKDWASQDFIWVLAASVLVFFGSLVIAWLLILRLPEDHLCRPAPTNCRKTPQSPLSYFVRKTVLNSLGFILLMTGIIMLFTPGQGVLFILLGVTLMDLPYKHEITRRLARRKGILRIINRIRRRSGKPALTTDHSA